MKQLTCEMCGSTELIKQDGFFVCQTCGCKYSVEEAKKMMIEGTVEVQGTVKVDNRDSVATYLSMAKNAYDANANEEVEEYCTKIIEIDPQNYEAWFMKGYAVGWQSTLGKVRIAETVNSFSNAIQFCPEDKKEELAEKCNGILLSLHKSLLSLRMKYFKDNPSEHNLEEIKGDISSVITNTIKFMKKTGVYLNDLPIRLVMDMLPHIDDAWSKTWNEYSKDNDGHPSDRALKDFMCEGDNIKALCEDILKRLLDEDPDLPASMQDVTKSLEGKPSYDNVKENNLKISLYKRMISYQEKIRDACSYELNFYPYGKYYEKSKSLTDKAKESRNYFIKQYTASIEFIKKKSNEIYWNNHKEEKERLDNEKKNLEDKKEKNIKQISELQKSKEKVPSLELLVNKQKEIESLESQKKALGLFKFKEKKALQEQIDSLVLEKGKIKTKVTAEQQEIEKQITHIRAELNKAIARIKEIDNELTMDRVEEEDDDE